MRDDNNNNLNNANDENSIVNHNKIDNNCDEKNRATYLQMRSHHILASLGYSRKLQFRSNTNDINRGQ